MPGKTEMYSFIGKRMGNPEVEVWTYKKIFLWACGSVILGFVTVILLGAF
jgi:hypothetical protein